MAYSSGTAKEPLLPASTPKPAPGAGLLQSIGTDWIVANGDALTLTDATADDAVDPWGIESGRSAIGGHANCVVINTIDDNTAFRPTHCTLAFAWFHTSDAATVSTACKVRLMGAVSQASNSKGLYPATITAAWPDMASGGIGCWFPLRSLDGDYEVTFGTSYAIHYTDASADFLYFSEPVDFALRGATKLVIPITQAAVLSAGTAMVLARLWS